MEIAGQQPTYSSTELKVGRVWAQALGLENEIPELTANFLSLGGDSVSAVLCMSRLRSLFGSELDIDLSDFFDERSTVKNFAGAIDKTNSTQL
jgi:acyl carrier protein